MDPNWQRELFEALEELRVEVPAKDEDSYADTIRAALHRIRSDAANAASQELAIAKLLELLEERAAGKTHIG